MHSDPNKPKTDQTIYNGSSNSHGAYKVLNTSSSKIERHEQTQQPYYGWNLRLTTPYQRANIFIMILICVVTGIYAYFSYLQWDILRKNMQTTLRAFVVLKGFEVIKHLDPKTQKVTHYIFTPQWENSGNTPTRNMVIYANVKWGPTPLPEDYGFPDFGDQKNIPVVLGPHATVGGFPLQVSIETIIAVKNKSSHLYLYGWAKYRDILEDTPEHITKFCWELIGIFDDPNDLRVSRINFSIFPKNNCADEECDKK